MAPGKIYYLLTIYDRLSNLNGTTSLEHLKTAWQTDLGMKITEEFWVETQM